MNGDDAPGTLNAELLEESGSNDSTARSKGVRVEKGATDDTHADDGKTTTEALRTVADNGSTSDGSEVGNDLDDGHLV